MFREVMRAAVLATVLVGCTNSGNAPPPRAPPIKAGIELADSFGSLKVGATTTRFNFAHLEVLWIRVNLPEMSRITTTALKVVSPRGHVFYEATVPFSSDPSVTTTNLPAIDHPVTVHRAETVPGGYHLDYSIAIAGSSFTRYPEIGQWQVMAEVAGKTLATSMDVTMAP